VKRIWLQWIKPGSIKFSSKCGITVSDNWGDDLRKTSDMKIAFVHDWINGMRGGERTLQAFLAIYPDADIFTLFHEPGTSSPEIDARVKNVSFLQRLPGSTKGYRALLPFYTMAVRKFDLSGYDLIISLSHAVAKNVIVPRGAKHICYCFTPMRYIWDQTAAYFGWKRHLYWPLIASLRRTDIQCSASVHHFVAISRFVAARIRHFYGRDSQVIYPPVNVDFINHTDESSAKKGEAFLCAGALVPYKRVDAVVDAFNELGEKLWISGTGPCDSDLRSRAKSNIEFLGFLTDAQLAERYRKCRALIFAGTEDFGMIPIECMAAGRPVIAVHKGGLKETVRGIKPWAPGELAPEDATGVFVRGDQHRLGASIAQSMRFFQQHEERFSAESCRRQAQLFSPQRFFSGWAELASKVGIAV
jgi:glycosyltransferase involved in cell wall biosynthesis